MAYRVLHTSMRKVNVHPVMLMHTKGPTVADVLAVKRRNDFIIDASEPVRYALRRLADLGTSSLIVVHNGTVKGLVTAHDLMRTLSSAPDMADALSLPVTASMTPSSRLVHVGLKDSVSTAASIMAELHVTHLPIVADGRVHGIVTLGDVADLLSRRGGKEAAVNIVAHRGISDGTQIDRPTGTDTGAPAHNNFSLAAETPLAGAASNNAVVPLPPLLCLRTGAAAAPRAPKRGTEKPSEDAYFTLHVAWPSTASTGHSQVISYLGVADGVGSWWEQGVDPRLYATALMEEAAGVVWRAAQSGKQPPAPVDVLEESWRRVAERRVVGSAAALVACLDPSRRQLIVHGVGDCGCIVLRDTDVNRVGSLLRGGTAAGIRPGFRVVARATQQLRGFNLPYQLGYSPDSRPGAFDIPQDGETLVLPLRPEDIVLAGSDGLFDNMDETDILAEVEGWDRVDLVRRRAEQEWATETGPQAHAHSHAGPRILEGTSVGAQSLALALVTRARESSGDRMRDGPFARLAKENDILWTQGGRPDDVTVIVALVSNHISAENASSIVVREPAVPDSRLRPFVPTDGSSQVDGHMRMQ